MEPTGHTLPTPLVAPALTLIPIWERLLDNFRGNYVEVMVPEPTPAMFSYFGQIFKGFNNVA